MTPNIVLVCIFAYSGIKANENADTLAKRTIHFFAPNQLSPCVCSLVINGGWPRFTRIRGTTLRITVVAHHWKSCGKHVSRFTGLGQESEQAGNRIINWPLNFETAPTCYGHPDNAYTGNLVRRMNSPIAYSVITQLWLGKERRCSARFGPSR